MESASVSDIIKCAGIHCHVRDSCYRYTAPQTEPTEQRWCAYYATHPFNRATGCEYLLTSTPRATRLFLDADKA